MEIFNRRMVLIVAICGGILIFSGVGLATTRQISGYAWSSNVGWIKMNGSTYGVSVDDQTGVMSGYAWSSNIGWIKFDGVRLNLVSNQVSGTAQACSALSNPAGCSGVVSAAAAGWEGLIKFSGPGYGVSRVVGPAGCTLEGWAWGSDVVGWVRFSGGSFSVTTTACPSITPPDVLGSISCDFGASPASVFLPRNTTVLNWSCEGADNCQIGGIGSVNAVSGSVTASVPQTKKFTLTCSNTGGDNFQKTIEVKVFRPTYCEIIPQGPGCK